MGHSGNWNTTERVLGFTCSQIHQMTYPLATLASSENHRRCVDIAVHRSEVQKVYEQQLLDISQPISCSGNTASLCLSLPLFLRVSFRICYRSINSFFPVLSFRPCFPSLFLRRRIVLGPTDHDSSYQHDCRQEKRTSVPRYRYIYMLLVLDWKMGSNEMIRFLWSSGSRYVADR